ncbi:MAG TPA: hypothetical protein VNK82_10985 [Terriglobales bacterium]|nr:hypothetical protein [Terriglobales bacterium]
MGQEAICKAQFGGRWSLGKARLESHELAFRGDFGLRIPFAGMKSIAARDGRLLVKCAEGTAVFELGPQAEKWAAKIKNPPSLMDKLGVKPGMCVAVLGVSDPDFAPTLRERLRKPVSRRLVKGLDIIFYSATRRAELKKLAALQRYLQPAGAIWVIRPKGTPEIKDMDVIAAGKAAGLVDVKVASFSPTHTAEKLVIPVKKR